MLMDITFSRKSLADRYSCLNGFLWSFAELKLFTFTQSKNLSNMSTNFAVSDTASPPVNVSALLTESLSTFVDIA